ncbi:dual specificity protein phosphatase family protein [Acinetobacter sp. CFCC 10889]|uniref:dual specificity protein phosphatase family protein n=1 Tax=Acinetobacter sp. CFCC 10889 TaxID=1775557 RepID=UPI000DD0301E|nr:dual specificity protein phosphatase family protein [Acinetobacter sp. CFCC 10889]
MKLHFLAILLTSSMMTGCITSSTLPQEQRPQQWGDLIQESSNFYQMSDTVFRSEQPNAQLIPLLKKHQIDVVINLRSRDKDSTTLAGQDLKLVHIPIHTWALDKHDLLSVMQSIRTAQQNNQKVLIHCYHGSDRTGASIAMYRIIFENWSTEDALKEMKHGGYGFHPIWVNIEKQFSPENIKWIREQLTNPSV